MGGSTVRQNCKRIPKVRAKSEIGSDEFTLSDHPDLVATLKNISKYNEWVEDRLMPIVGKWIEENRDRIIEGMSEEEMNDTGAAVEKAYSLLVEDGYVEEREQAALEVEILPENVNPIWRKENIDRNR